METIQMLGSLGEFVGARDESEKAVLEARTTGVRELAMSAATSEGLSAALTKAWEAVGEAPGAFAAELISRGLDRQEAERVRRWYFATWRLNATQFESSGARADFDVPLRDSYSRGVGRLFWDSFPPLYPAFSDHVNRLIAEVDRRQEKPQ